MCTFSSEHQKRWITWSQRVALLPTVVNCAGWRWVKPRQGKPA